MIKRPESLFISIFIHTLLIATVLFAWKSYSDVKKVENKKRIHLKLSDVVATTEIVKPKPKPKPKKIEKPKPKPKPKPKKIARKVIKEPVKIYDFAVEEVPQELAIVNKRVIRKKVVKADVIKKVIARKETAKKTVIVKEIVKEHKRETKKPNQKKSSTQYLEINTEKIAKLLKENLYYPRSARKRNITGEVIIKFTLNMDAKVYDIKIIKSKSDILSRAAMKTIMGLSGKFPKPQKKLTLHVPITYTLK
ncbi:MAG: TonB family protein [Sulfurimonas sp.]|nr:TonB family protein [Sulfurimonas sp.]